MDLRLDALAGLSHFTQEKHCQLGAETSTQAQGKIGLVSATLGKVKIAQIWVRLKILIDVGNRRHNAGFKRFNCNNILHANAHGMPGKAFGVCNNHLVGLGTKNLAQCVNFSARAAASCRRVGFMRHKHCFVGNRVALEPKSILNCVQQGIHHMTNVLDINARAMKSAVGNLAGKNFGNGFNATFNRAIHRFNHQSCSSHTHNHAVTAFIKRQNRLAQVTLGASSATGKQASANPTCQVFIGYFVAGNYNHAARSASANPVFRQPNRLGGRSTGSVHAGVGSARANQLSKLRMPH